MASKILISPDDLRTQALELSKISTQMYDIHTKAKRAIELIHEATNSKYSSNMKNQGDKLLANAYVLADKLSEGCIIAVRAAENFENTDKIIRESIKDLPDEVRQSSPSEQKVILSCSTPLIGQSKNYTCGAASGVMVLAALGHTISEDLFAQKAGTSPSSGTVTANIVTTINNELGYNKCYYSYTKSQSEAEFKEKLTASLTSGSPAIVNVSIPANDKGAFGYNADGHYIVITGLYQDENGVDRVIINDPFSSAGPGNPQRIEMTLSDLKKYNEYGWNGYSIFGS